MQQLGFSEFESRQRAWRGAEREFRQFHGRGVVRVWRIRVDGNRVFVSYGILGGLMQETNFSGAEKNIGRSNYISPAEDALAEARREVRKKWDFEGYDEFIDGNNVDRRHQNPDICTLLNSLPSSFCLYKPNSDLTSCPDLVAKVKDGSAWYTRKRDGMTFLVVIGLDGLATLYSRRARKWADAEEPKENVDGTLDFSAVRTWNDRFSYLVEAVSCMRLPPHSMLAVELTCVEDDFEYISKIVKGYTDRALKEMADNKFPVFYIWDMPFFSGQDMLACSILGERMNLVESHLSNVPIKYKQYLIPLEIRKFTSSEEAKEEAKSRGIEGWVVVDPTAYYGDRGWNLKGKPDRPKACAKLKPCLEGDFIALWDPEEGYGEKGTGKHEKGKMVTLPDGNIVEHGGVGSIALFELSRYGEYIYISKCSSGMDYALQAQLRKEHFPMVVQVQYVSRTYISEGDKTNALKFPIFIRVREDKSVSECVNRRL